MCDGCSVDFEVGAGVGFLCVDDLLDRDGAEGFFAVRLAAAAALAVLLRAAVDEAAGVVASLGAV